MPIDNLVALLRILDARPSWRLSELPSEITPEILIDLDRFKLIELRRWTRNAYGRQLPEAAPHPYESWYVVSDNEGYAGPFASLASKTYEPGCEPAIRVSPKGADWLRDSDARVEAGKAHAPNYCTADDLRQRIGIHIPKLNSSNRCSWESMPPDVQTLVAKIIEIDPQGRPYFVRYWSDAGDSERHWPSFLKVHLRDLAGWDLDRANAALGKAVIMGLAARPNPSGGAQFIEDKLVFGDYVYLTEAAHDAWQQSGIPTPALGKSKACLVRDLLEFLESTQSANLTELHSAGFLVPDLITICDAKGWIEFASVERGEIPKPYHWHSHASAGYMPWSQVLPDVVNGKITGLLVRITAPGRAELARMRLSIPSGPKESAAGETKSDVTAMSGEAMAMAVLTEHPDWTDTRIAKTVGISRTTLYDYPKFKNLRAMMKGKPKARDRSKGRTGKRLPDVLPDTQADTLDDETLE